MASERPHVAIFGSDPPSLPGCHRLPRRILRQHGVVCGSSDLVQRGLLRCRLDLGSLVPFGGDAAATPPTRHRVNQRLLGADGVFVRRGRYTLVKGQEGFSSSPLSLAPVDAAAARRHRFFGAIVVVVRGAGILLGVPAPSIAAAAALPARSSVPEPLAPVCSRRPNDCPRLGAAFFS